MILLYQTYNRLLVAFLSLFMKIENMPFESTLGRDIPSQNVGTISLIRGRSPFAFRRSVMYTEKEESLTKNSTHNVILSPDIQFKTAGINTNKIASYIGVGTIGIIMIELAYGAGFLISGSPTLNL